MKTIIAVISYCVSLISGSSVFGQCALPVSYFLQASSNEVIFEVNPSQIPGESFNTYLWDFGNNSPLYYTTDTIVELDYLLPGTYYVTVYGYGTANCSSQLVVQVNEPLSGCYSFFTFQPSLNTFYSYSFSGIAGNGCTPYTYSWNFGNTTQNPNYFVLQSLSEICLTITDCSGCSDVYCEFITPNFNPVLPEIYSNISPTNGCNGLIALSSNLLSCPGSLISEPPGSVDFSSMLISGDTVYFNTCMEVSGIGLVDTLGGICSTAMINTGGIDEPEDSNLIYPNPFKDEILFYFDDNAEHSVQLMNSLGQLVFEGNLSISEPSINTERLERGVYFVKVDRSFVRSMIKQ